jgi:hypothetical protein
MEVQIVDMPPAMQLIEMPLRKANVSGIADNDLTNLGIVGTFAAPKKTTEDKIIGLFLQYADYGIG